MEHRYSLIADTEETLMKQILRRTFDALRPNSPIPCYTDTFTLVN